MNDIMPGVSRSIAEKYGITDSPMDRLFAQMEELAEKGDKNALSGFSEGYGPHLNYIAGAVSSLLPDYPLWPLNPAEKPTHWHNVPLNDIQRDIAKTVEIYPELCEIGILYADDAISLEIRKNVENILRDFWRSLGEREKHLLDMMGEGSGPKDSDALKTKAVSRRCQRL